MKKHAGDCVGHKNEPSVRPERGVVHAFVLWNGRLPPEGHEIQEQSRPLLDVASSGIADLVNYQPWDGRVADEIRYGKCYPNKSKKDSP